MGANPAGCGGMLGFTIVFRGKDECERFMTALDELALQDNRSRSEVLCRLVEERCEAHGENPVQTGRTREECKSQIVDISKW